MVKCGDKMASYMIYIMILDIFFTLLACRIVGSVST